MQVYSYSFCVINHDSNTIIILDMIYDPGSITCVAAGLPIVVPNETMAKLWDLSDTTPGEIVGCTTLMGYMNLFRVLPHQIFR